MHFSECTSLYFFAENDSDIECAHPWPQAKKAISVVWCVGHLEETALHSGQSILVCEYIFYCSGKSIVNVHSIIVQDRVHCSLYHVSINTDVTLL